MNQHKPSKPAYRDPARPIGERVEDLISRMTLQEKISQMVHEAPPIERLGVPAYDWWNECLHGVGRAGIATVFPQAIGLAATWNTDLMLEVATAISDEARAKHHDAVRRGLRARYTGLTFWSPNVNIFRDPRWGRGQETYGEDPYLTARMGVAFCRGLQGDDPDYLKLVATPKHYAVHSGPEPERHAFNAVVAARDLRETYLPAFEACVREAGAYSVMGAYNRTNGEPCCASPALLQEILRDEWGFEGYVVSDCWAIRDIYENHRVVETAAQAAALAVEAGCDLNCGEAYPALLEAVEQDLIEEDLIDRAVKRLFTARFRLGMFDPPEQVPYAQIPYQVVDSPAHRALARRAARESIVLLKNEGSLLPLPRDMGSLAVIGPNADDREVLLGNYNGTPSRAVSVLEGIRAKLAPGARLYYAPGRALAPGLPVLEPIPSARLRPADGDAGEAGLTGSYFANAAFEGQPARVRVDPSVNFVWRATTPITGRRGDRFSVRWSGWLTPAVSGTYQLGVRGCSSYRLYLDGEQVLALPFHYRPAARHAEVELEAGRLYDLRLDYVNDRTDHAPQVQLLWKTPQSDPLGQALEVARKADAVVLVLGLSPALEGEEMPVDVPGFRGGDRTEIGLPRPQDELLRLVRVVGKPVVLVLLSGSALAIPWAAENVPAIVQAWYPGQAGDAVADVLFGDYNPAGRLPVTVYRSLDDLPPFEAYAMEGRTYRYFRGEPLFPFGHGLSYTRFAYSDLTLSAETVTPGESLTVAVDVRNVGELAGDEVVQLYLTDLEASVPVPIRRLVGFRRVYLAPGEVRRLRFVVKPRQLSLIDDRGRRVIESGIFRVAVGGRQPVEGVGYRRSVAEGEVALAAEFEVAV